MSRSGRDQRADGERRTESARDEVQRRENVLQEARVGELGTVQERLGPLGVEFGQDGAKLTELIEHLPARASKESALGRSATARGRGTHICSA